MLLHLTFLLMYVFGYVYVFLEGGQAGKSWILLTLVATLLSRVPLEFYADQFAILVIFGIDALCFLCFVWLAMVFRRGWMIWCGGFQLAAVVAHFAAIITPGITVSVHSALTSFWVVPIFLVTIIGISRDRAFSG